MTKTPQWNVKGIDAATRTVARDAAAVAGLPIGTWIDRAVKRAAAAPPRVAPPPVQPSIEPARSLIELAAGDTAIDIDRSPAAPLTVGASPEIPLDRVSSSPSARGIGRSLRLALAVALMATLTGGAAWRMGGQLLAPSAPEKPASPTQAASGFPPPPRAATTVSTHAQPASAPGRSPATTAESPAIEGLRLTAQAGDARAQYDLGAIYERGRGAATSGVLETEKLPAAQEETAVSRTTVAEIQRLLSRLDFDPGPSDGVLGKKTAKAIAKYQAMSGMTADGNASAFLLEELREVAGAAKR